jgi:hypothetical protein
MGLFDFLRRQTTEQVPGQATLPSHGPHESHESLAAEPSAESSDDPPSGASAGASNQSETALNAPPAWRLLAPLRPSVPMIARTFDTDLSSSLRAHRRADDLLATAPLGHTVNPAAAGVVDGLAVVTDVATTPTLSAGLDGVLRRKVLSAAEWPAADRSHARWPILARATSPASGAGASVSTSTSTSTPLVAADVGVLRRQADSVMSADAVVGAAFAENEPDVASLVADAAGVRPSDPLSGLAATDEAFTVPVPGAVQRQAEEAPAVVRSLAVSPTLAARPPLLRTADAENSPTMSIRPASVTSNAPSDGPPVRAFATLPVVASVQRVADAPSSMVSPTAMVTRSAPVATEMGPVDQPVRRAANEGSIQPTIRRRAIVEISNVEGSRSSGEPTTHTADAPAVSPNFSAVSQQAVDTAFGADARPQPESVVVQRDAQSSSSDATSPLSVPDEVFDGGGPIVERGTLGARRGLGAPLAQLPTSVQRRADDDDPFAGWNDDPPAMPLLSAGTSGSDDESAAMSASVANQVPSSSTGSSSSGSSSAGEEGAWAPPALPTVDAVSSRTPAPDHIARIADTASEPQATVIGLLGERPIAASRIAGAPLTSATGSDVPASDAVVAVQRSVSRESVMRTGGSGDRIVTASSPASARTSSDPQRHDGTDSSGDGDTRIWRSADLDTTGSDAVRSLPVATPAAPWPRADESVGFASQPGSTPLSVSLSTMTSRGVAAGSSVSSASVSSASVSSAVSRSVDSSASRIIDSGSPAVRVMRSGDSVGAPALRTIGRATEVVPRPIDDAGGGVGSVATLQRTDDADGESPVQRMDDSFVAPDDAGGATDSSSSPASPSSGASAPGVSSSGASGASSAQSDADLDQLAGKLYDRLRFRLRRELLDDRERAGMALDRVR